MHLFNAQDKLKKYTSVPEIIDDYFETRLQLYQVRKDHLIASLTQDLLLLSNKSKYIQENLNGTVDLRKKNSEEVTAMLHGKGYSILGEGGDYKYLTRMPMDSVTQENVAKLNKDHDAKMCDLENVKKTPIQAMWLQELEELEKEYVVFKELKEREKDRVVEDKKDGVKKRKMIVKK